MARSAMASWLSAFSSAYLPGDVVPMMRRTQHSGVRVHTDFFFAVSYSHGVPPSPFFYSTATNRMARGAASCFAAISHGSTRKIRGCTGRRTRCRAV